MPVRRIGIEVGKSFSWARGDDQIEVTALASTWAENRIAELEAALTHAVEIAENKRIGGTWDDLLPYRALLNPKK